MSERQEQVQFVIDMIDKVCKEYNLGLVPYQLKDGQYVVAINDTLEGKTYVRVEDK
ncbi:MAG: hypothetical protein ACRCX2_10130 [Paraclostridium sp.]